ncbi:PREDICTED: uncharacterized protein LOC103811368, partial [Acanthisitta chloris]|uniref:uncharacterized protein LOC103811368 n=1 Tax=Acanthisitta chloris TaxID=57068 RepID=UPI0004F0F88B
KLSKAEVLSPCEKSHRHLPNTEDNMDIKTVIKTQGSISSLRDLSDSGEDLLNFNDTVSVTAGIAEEYCSRQVPSCLTDVPPCHTDNCCLNTEDSESGQTLADVQAHEKPGLGRPQTTDSLLSEQAITGNHSDFVTDDSANSATVLEVRAEKVPSVSDDFSDDDMEYFECSDVLTVYEDEIWKKKLQFLLESDDEDDLKLSKDCDGCAYFLSETPYLLQVSDNTTPMDTPIGFSGHHSKFKGVNVRRDPSMYSQSTLQTEMTLTVGHHREKSTGLKDKEKNKVPVASAAIGNEHPRSEEETGGSGQSAAGVSPGSPEHGEAVPAEAEPPARAIGSAWTERAPGAVAEDGDVLGKGSVLLQQGRRNVPEENAQHAVCTLTESLRRNFFKLFNPIELCRYVSTIGQSFQAAAEVKECSAPSPDQGGVLSTLTPGETESLEMQAGLCQTEEADKDCRWEGKRTPGLAEQNRMPAENVSLGNQGTDLKSVTQNCERPCMESQTEQEGASRACESAGTSQPDAEMLSTENTLQAKNTDLQTSVQHCVPCDKRESCHQEVICGQEIISNGNKSKHDISPLPVWDTDSVPNKQECLCAVLSSAKLCDEPREGEHRYGFDVHESSDPDILCSLSGDEAVFEANPKSILESGEPGCKEDADTSAVHEELWKLLHEDDSDYQIPFENRGTTSLEMTPTDVRVTESNVVWETCSDHPLPMELIEEQEPVTEPASNHRTEKADCNVSDLLLPTAEVCNSASIGHICLAGVVGADGVCVHCSAVNRTETPPPICVSANSTGECLEPRTRVTASSGSPVAWEGELAVNNAAQTCDAESPRRLQNAQSGNLANPAYMSGTSHGTIGQLLHSEHNISLVSESVPSEGCRFRDCCLETGQLDYFPEKKDIFPSESTSQFTHEEHSSVNTVHESYKVNLQEKGNYSDLNAQNDTISDSYHLSERNGCQDFPVVFDTEKCAHVMQLPALIKTPQTKTHNNLLQNTDQLTEIANQEGAPTASSGHPFLRDFYLGVPNSEPCKPGGEQREICTADEHRAETSCGSGVGQASESQTAVSPCNIAEHVFFVDSTFKSDEELKIDTSKTPTYGSVTPVSAPLPRTAQSEHHSTAGEECRGAGDQLGTPELTGKETLPFLTPVSDSESLLPGASAVGCPGTGSQVQTGSTQTGVKVNGDLSTPEAPCQASRGLFQRAPGDTQEEAALCESEQEIQRAIEHNPDEAETKGPSHTSVSSQAQRRTTTISAEQSWPGSIPSSKLTEAGHSVKSTEDNNEEEVMTAESVVSGLVNLPPVDSGNSRCRQEQPPCSRTRPFSSAVTERDPFPVNAERQRNQEGPNSWQAPPAAAEPEPVEGKQDTAKSGHAAAGAKKKLPPAALSKKPRLEEKGSVSKDPSCAGKPGKGEAGATHKEDRKEQRKLILKKDTK